MEQTVDSAVPQNLDKNAGNRGSWRGSQRHRIDASNRSEQDKDANDENNTDDQDNATNDQNNIGNERNDAGDHNNSGDEKRPYQ